jgi:E3 ubiquitin-protein ligase makorin
MAFNPPSTPNPKRGTFPCKFFRIGQCSKKNCNFSHDPEGYAELRTRSVEVCPFFLQGNCRYGQVCAFRHAALPEPGLHARSLLPPTALPPATLAVAGEMRPMSIHMSPSAPGASRHPPSVSTSSMSIAAPGARTLCAFAVLGKCPYPASECRYAHGLQCPHCRKYVLDPQSTLAQQAHLDECAGGDSSAGDAEEGDDRSQLTALECGICLNVVQDKKDPRYGLLRCAHCFCLDCIRRWRVQGDGGQDLSKVRCPPLSLSCFLASLLHEHLGAGRSPLHPSPQQHPPSPQSCPVCRVQTHFIVPSTIWPVDEGHRDTLFGEYMASLRWVPCFDLDLDAGTGCFQPRVVARRSSPPPPNTQEDTMQALQPGPGHLPLWQQLPLQARG